MMRRVVLGMLALGLIGVGAAPAAAAPGDDDDVFTITCDDGPTLEVVIGPGLGVWTPAFVVGSDQRVIPYAISGTFEIASNDPDIDPVIIDVDEAKKAPKNGRHYEGCSFSDGGFGGLTGETLVSFSLTPG